MPTTPNCTDLNWMEYHTGYQYPYCSLDFRFNPNPDASSMHSETINGHQVYHPCCGIPTK